MKAEASFVYLKNVRLHAYHGTSAQERKVGNDFIVNVRACYPLETAMHSDMVEDALDYSAMFRIVRQEMDKPSRLLENVVQRIGKELFRAFPETVSLEIDVRKINPPMGADSEGAGVQIHLINDKSL